MDKETGGEPDKDVEQAERQDENPKSMQRSRAGSGAQRVEMTQTECQREMLFGSGHAR